MSPVRVELDGRHVATFGPEWVSTYILLGQNKLRIIYKGDETGGVFVNDAYFRLYQPGVYKSLPVKMVSNFCGRRAVSKHDLRIVRTRK